MPLQFRSGTVQTPPISAVLHLQQFRFAATREQGRHAEAHLPRAIAAAERPRGQLHVMLRPESVGETTTVRTFVSRSRLKQNN